MTEHREPWQPRWTAWALMAAAAALTLLLAYVTWRLWTAAMPVCDKSFPARNGLYPSWVYVFGAITAFAAGHATGQIAIRRGRQSQQELGEARWANPAAVVAVNASVALFLFVVTILLVIEAWTLGHGVWPITYYTRCATDASAPIALLGSATWAFVIGRWMWVFRG